MHKSTLIGSAVARRALVDSLASSLADLAIQQDHPAGLYLLCAVEFCERLASFMVLSLLVLYLNECLGLGTGLAAKVVNYVHGLSYIAGVLGGVLADRKLGARCAAIGGLILLAISLGVLALAHASQRGLWAAVAFSVAGYGLFRPNVTALVGGLYSQSDPRRAAAFRWFYYSINVGALLGPGLAGILRASVGWDATFRVAAVYMAGTSVILSLGKRLLICGVAGSAVTSCTASAPATGKGDSRPSGQRGWMLGLVLVVIALFGAALSQGYGTLLLWARDDAERTLMGYQVPPEFFAMMPAGFVLLLGPLLGRCMKTWAARGRVLPESGKFTAGMLFCALGYGLMLIASLAHRQPTLGSPLWLVACKGALALGEILGVPVGLALAEAMAKSRSKGLVLGLTYGAHALGYWLGGAVGALWPIWSHTRFFGVLALGCFMAAILIQSQAQRFARVLPGLS